MKKSNRKIVSLSVHKNNREQRRRHQVRKQMVQDAKIVGGEAQVTGYIIMGFNDDGHTAFAWQENNAVKSHGMPDFARTQILRRLAKLDWSEDE